MQALMPKAEGDDDLMEDSDVDIDDDDEGHSLAASDEEVDEDGDDNGSDDDGLSFVEGSDNEDLISLDGELPEGLIAYDGSDAEDDDDKVEEVWGGISGPAAGTKRKRDETKSERRKKLRSLPTFASYEDYAKMIEDGPEDVL